MADVKTMGKQKNNSDIELVKSIGRKIKRKWGPYVRATNVVSHVKTIGGKAFLLFLFFLLGMGMFMINGRLLVPVHEIGHVAAAYLTGGGGYVAHWGVNNGGLARVQGGSFHLVHYAGHYFEMMLPPLAAFFLLRRRPRLIGAALLGYSPMVISRAAEHPTEAPGPAFYVLLVLLYSFIFLFLLIKLFKAVRAKKRLTTAAG